ncbi:MAG: glycosyltransferase family 2 protein [Vicinamibacterales bacterium]
MDALPFRSHARDGVGKVIGGVVRPSPELSVVMPVYNEAGNIGPVVLSWLEELDRLEIDYELRAYDDGSRDDTLSILRRIARGHPQLIALHHQNIGHGRTISRGYRESRSEWVFQIDSDGEMGPEPFAELWAVREHYDLLLGCRGNRQTSLARRVISRGSRLVVRTLFGGGLWDVNTPYRLVRSRTLAWMLPSIPPDAFAPNVMMTGLARLGGLRIHQQWIAHQPRRSGTSSIAGFSQWAVAARCTAETLAVARRARGRATAREALTRDGR